MTKRTREKWAARVRAWRESGKSAEAFVADKDYSASSLRGAVSQLADGSASTPAKATPAVAPPRRDPAPKAPRFAPVRVRRNGPGLGPVAEMVVEVGAARIRVSRGADLSLLGDVVRALQGGAR